MELLSPQPGPSGVPPASPLEALLRSPLRSLSGVLGSALIYLFLALARASRASVHLALRRVIESAVALAS